MRLELKIQRALVKSTIKLNAFGLCIQDILFLIIRLQPTVLKVNYNALLKNVLTLLDFLFYPKAHANLNLFNYHQTKPSLNTKSILLHFSLQKHFLSHRRLRVLILVLERSKSLFLINLSILRYRTDRNCLLRNTTLNNIVILMSVYAGRPTVRLPTVTLQFILIHLRSKLLNANVVVHHVNTLLISIMLILIVDLSNNVVYIFSINTNPSLFTNIFPLTVEILRSFIVRQQERTIL
mmetsp:Transcript_12575/g.15767  ORF Transcript_12575/g.15767 Transcript_12575/m.15767 type:complete len:237 (+) Transcript_12575:89-799(+)